MKRLFKIGVLLLFMIGMFAVQAGFSTATLVDDDVGVEFATNVDVSDDAIIMNDIIMHGQVESPLKYLIAVENYETKFSTNHGQEICSEVSIDLAMIIWDDNYTPGKVLTNLTNQKEKDELFKYSFIVMDLFRLDIGESFEQNCIIQITKK